MSTGGLKNFIQKYSSITFEGYKNLPPCTKSEKNYNDSSQEKSVKCRRTGEHGSINELYQIGPKKDSGFKFCQEILNIKSYILFFVKNHFWEKK